MQHLHYHPGKVGWLWLLTDFWTEYNQSPVQGRVWLWCGSWRRGRRDVLWEPGAVGRSVHVEGMEMVPDRCWQCGYSPLFGRVLVSVECGIDGAIWHIQHKDRQRELNRVCRCERWGRRSICPYHSSAYLLMQSGIDGDVRHIHHMGRMRE